MKKWKSVIHATAVTLGGGFGFLILGLLAVLAASRAGWIEDQSGELAVTGIYAVGMMAGAMWIGAAWMRSIDEAAREAHKAAWYWGGSGGMCVGGVLLILASQGPWRDVLAGEFTGGGEPLDYMIVGAVMMIAPMLIGYTVVWLWWWLARMRG